MELPPLTTAQIIDAAHERVRDEKPRPHLGASLIGHHCERWLWYSFRWVIQEQFNGRMLRLFRRGQLEEDQVIFDLRQAGLEVSERDPKTGQQYRISDGHFGGSLDGIITFGVPEAKAKNHVLEIKTHSKKSFTDMVKQGVKKAKPQHYAQMQVYMLNTKIDRALYYSVCKDNDEIYTERVKLDKSFAESMHEKAQRIIATDRPPEPISADPSWFQCKFCAAHSLCHKNDVSEIKINCRTCLHFTANRDGTSSCNKWNDVIPVEYQHNGCPNHLINPYLVPYQFKGECKPDHVLYEHEGKQMINGPDELKSSEIIAGINFANEPLVKELKSLGAEIMPAVEEFTAPCHAQQKERGQALCDCKAIGDCWDIPF